MNRLLLFFASLASLAALSSDAVARPGTAQEAVVLDASKLSDEIDRSLRWLRAQQEADGGYGSPSVTAQTLLAFVDSRRAYRHGDGPFVDHAAEALVAAQAADGSIADEGATDVRRKESTLAALRALEALDAPATRETRARAAAFLGLELPLPAGDTTDALAEMPADSLLDRAAALLIERREDGSWGGSAETTATRIVELNALRRALAARPSPPRAEAKAEALPAFSAQDRASAAKALERGASFLVESATDGRWGFDGRADPGITAMVVGALLTVPDRGDALQAEIDAALDWLVSLQKPDGSIHAGQLANYVTSASVMALARRGREQDRRVIERARDYLLLLQADGGEGYAESDRYYGGVGYGGDERPDLSNLQMALDALRAAGVSEDDEAFQKALVFLQRCQNRSESNDLELARGDEVVISGEDGGAGYAPGESKAGFVELADGKRVPRSYGSMTYALLKGYLLAGLEKDDPRVEAAWSWLMANYTLDVNPGFEASADQSAAYQGFFYYLLAMARALDLYGEDAITDALGNEHAWRQELIGRLVGLQRQDGSWLNRNAARWYEGNPVLATAYAMLTLDAARGEGAG